MLSSEERAAIEAEARHYEQPAAACIEALKIVQEARGWVSDEGIKDIAAALRMSPHEVDGVATFYNLIYRRPVGRHVIHVCDSISCWVMGGGAVCDHLCTGLGIRPGQTSADDRFTVIPIACLGACDHAPAMMVRRDLHADLTSEKIDRILEDYR